MGYMFWAELLIQSSLVLIVCQAMHSVPKRTDAAERYRIAFFAFVLLALFPVLSAVLPPLHATAWLHHPRASVTVEMGPLLAKHATRQLRPRLDLSEWLVLAWSAGAVLGLAWLAAGRIAVGRMSRQAVPLNDPEQLQLVSELSRAMHLRRKPQILISGRSAMPATFGIVRPRILLPAECMEWTTLRWRVVLLHELAHIKRRDATAQLFALAVCAVWWFQPLAWWMRGVLRQDSERASDALALSLHMQASDYAAELLAIARETRLTPVMSCAAIGMASVHLEKRIQAILHPRTPASRARGLAGILLVGLSGTGIPAIDLGGSPMKRTILSGLLASASLSAATISGTVLDPSGAVIPNANVVLFNPDTSAQQQATSAGDGKFSFSSLPAGQYILRVEKPGFADLFREYTVEQDAKVARALVMELGHVEEDVSVQSAGKASTGSQATTQANTRPIRVGGDVAASNLVKKVAPVYPPSAKAEGVQGTVMLEAVILKDGTPSEVTVLSSPSDDLSQSALEAVRQWRYRPTLLNGEPVEIVTDIRVTYTLRE